MYVDACIMEAGRHESIHVYMHVGRHLSWEQVCSLLSWSFSIWWGNPSLLDYNDVIMLHC